MARKEKDNNSAKDSTKKKNTDNEGDVFAPLKIAQTVQQQIKDFKVIPIMLSFICSYKLV